MPKDIQLIRDCKWEEVFLEWYKNEEKDSWKALAKERGYSSWADWRLNAYAKHFDCSNAKWGLYAIHEPSEVVGEWFGGPFRTWIERYYNGLKTKTFADLVKEPAVLSHSGIQAIAKDYPTESIIIALRLKTGKVFVVEGMHRACALSLLASSGNKQPNKLVFAIGDSDLYELPTVGKNCN